MEHMPRTSISLPDTLFEEIYALREDKQFARWSFSKIVRYLLDLGLVTHHRMNPPKKED